MSKKDRLAHFKERMGDDPNSVYELAEHGEFVTVHPMSDEGALLDELGVRPESCTKVDLFWKHEGDVAFVQIESALHSSRPPGAYVRRAPSGYLNIVIIVPDPDISSAIVVGSLRGIAGAVPALDLDRIGPNLSPIQNSQV